MSTKFMTDDQSNNQGREANKPRPRVSVCMITYNHEKYIAEALDGVFSQKADFEFEVIIGVDCSTDKTKTIVESYVKRFPGRICPEYYMTRVGLKRNFVETLGRCLGEYVAVLSGDDYWIDKDKLQKQVDFLNSNPDYVLTGCNALAHVDGTNFDLARPAKQVSSDYDVTVSDITLKGPYIASMIMFRNITQNFPHVYFTIALEDQPLYLLLAEKGKCRFHNAVAGVYRIHSQSMTSGGSSPNEYAFNRDALRFLFWWNKVYGDKYPGLFEQILKRHTLAIVGVSLRQRNVKRALYYAKFLDIESTQSPHAKILRLSLKICSILLHKFSLIDSWI